jgi:cyanate lyase
MLTNTSLPTDNTIPGLTFADIGKALGRDECWVAALFYAQAKPIGNDFDNLAKVLDVEKGSIKDELGDHWFPNRGDLGPVPPKDATIYRLYEVSVHLPETFNSVDEV